MSPTRMRLLGMLVGLLAVLGVGLATAIAFSAGTALVTALVVMVPVTVAFAAIATALEPVCRAVPLTLGDPWRPVAVHAAGALLTAALWTGLAGLWAGIVDRAPGVDPFGDPALRFVFVAGVFLYLLTMAFHSLRAEQGRLAEAEERALELRALAREAELQALKSQINPHFLFNSLNSISALCGSDPEGARSMTEKLAGFFRRTVQLGRQETIPLSSEIDLVRHYLDIERIRFGARLRFVLEVDEKVSGARVPPLTLQPLVENAIRHGISQRLDGGEVRLTVTSTGSHAKVVVENDVDADGGLEEGTGTGLENVRRRLRAQFGEAAAMRVEPSGSRFRVALAIPLADDRLVRPEAAERRSARG